MTVQTPPPYLTRGTYTAQADRLVMQSQVRTAGVAQSADLKVSPNGTPNNTVSVAAGAGFVISGESQKGMYLVYNDGPVTVTIPNADATNPRYDLIIAQVRDQDGSGTNNDCRIVVVSGVAAPSPVVPSLSGYPNNIVLAQVYVAAVAGGGAPTINAGNITDKRTKANIPDASVSTLSAITSPVEGQVAYDLSQHKLFVYDNTSTWQLVWPITAGAITGSMIAANTITPSNMQAGTYGPGFNINGNASYATSAGNSGQLGGYSASIGIAANTVPVRDGSGDVYAHNHLGSFLYLNDTTGRGADTGVIVYLQQNIYGAGVQNFLTGQNYTGATMVNIGPYGAYYYASDEALKQDIADADKDVLSSAVDNIKIRTFAFKESPDQKHTGVIAQELETVLPEAVEQMGETKGVNINPVVWALVAKVQELEKRVAELEKK